MKKEVRNYHGDLAAIQEIFMSMSVRFDSIYYINLVENTFFAPAQTEAAAVNYSHSGNYTDMVHKMCIRDRQGGANEKTGCCRETKFYPEISVVLLCNYGYLPDVFLGVIWIYSGTDVYKRQI